MDSIVKAQHIIRRYFPRNHLWLASALGVALILVTTLVPDEPANGDRLRRDKALISQTSGTDGLNEALALTGIAGPVLPGGQAAAGEAADSRANWHSLTVQPGDNLSTIFGRVGLSDQELYRIINSSDEAGILNRLFPGYKLSFHIPKPGKLEQLQVFMSPLEGFVFTRQDAFYQVEPIQLTADVVQVVNQGAIADSLFLAGQQAEIPANVIMGMADIFGGVIDFLMDPRSGDQFSIVYEEKYLNGEFIGTGEILGAQFINRGREHVAVRYENTQGDVGFFSPDGESMQKAFLRNPLDVFRISSNFNPNRRHPILNTIRAHRGTDYAAPTGTPIRATADGTVTWAARNGSFGKLVVIQHNDSFETKYAHLNDYAGSIKKGSRVQQGQIIGYVGSTGGATGPHLHYEFLVNGVHKDPRTIVDELPQAISLEAKEMPRFLEHASKILKRFNEARPDGRLLTYTNTPSQAAGSE